MIFLWCFYMSDLLQEKIIAAYKNDDIIHHPI